MVLALIIGYFAGTVLAFLAVRRLLNSLASRWAMHDAQRRSMKVAGAVFGAIALAPSIFLTMIVGGGDVAGRYARAASAALGWGEAGAYPLVSVSLVVIITVTVSVVAAMGAVTGYLGAPKGDRPSLTLRTDHRP